MVCLELDFQFAAPLTVAAAGIGRRTGGGVAVGLRKRERERGSRVKSQDSWYEWYDLLRVSRFWMSVAMQGLATALVL